MSHLTQLVHRRRSTTPHRRARALVVAALLGAAAIGAPVDSVADAAEHPRSMSEAQAREAEAHAALEDSSAAVQAAAAALLNVEEKLPAAQAAAASARGTLLGAKAKARAAGAAAAKAEQARATAQDEVARADDQVARSRDSVAALARRTYQQGRLGGLQQVLDSTDPQDALERADLLRSVLRSSDHALQAVTDARLDLARRRADLVVQEKAAARARQAADAEEEGAAQAAAAADDAVAEVAALTEQRRQALASAEANRQQDRRDYEEAQRASAELAEQIRQAAERAAREEAARQAAARAAAERAAAEAARRGQPAPAPAPAPDGSDVGTGRMAWPAPGRLTSRFGYRTHPIYGDRRLHAGIDIGAGTGTPVRSADDGVVLLSYFSSSYGNLIVIDHGGGISTMYAHQSARLVTAGQRVARGQLIGRVGSTGNSTGPHLHFEVRVDGEPVDPLRYVSPP